MVLGPMLRLLRNRVFEDCPGDSFVIKKKKKKDKSRSRTRSRTCSIVWSLYSASKAMEVPMLQSSWVSRASDHVLMVNLDKSQCL